MATIVTRDTKGSPLTFEELDANFVNLNENGVRTATADETIANNSLAYIKSNGNLALASASSEGKEAMCFVKTGGSIGAVIKYHPLNEIWDGLSGLTPGAAYYMGTTPGSIVTSASAPNTTGNVLMKVGIALSATELAFRPEPPVTL